MNEILSLLLAFAAGIAMGGLFFGGLWLTVKKVTRDLRSALFFIISFILRMGFIGIVVFLFRAHWKWLGAGLFGFIMARAFLLSRLRREQTASRKSETFYAHYS